jgi:ABC-type multidrug transport system permease subunit
MSWNWRAIRAVIRKDLVQVAQNRSVVLPMILVPAILQVLMPLGMILLPQLIPSAEADFSDLEPMLAALPPALQAQIQGLTFDQIWIVFASNYLFAPLFLVVPLMVSSIIGSDSFVGEKERGTMEALFFTPISDTELFVAKLLTAFVPAQIIALASFVVYGFVVNLSGYGAIGHVFFPTVTWWPLVFWLSPAISLAGLGAVVLISSKAKTFMQAQQVSGMLVLPVVFLMIGQATGLFFLGVGLTMGIGLLVWLAGAWLVWVGARTFSRDQMISRI